MAALEKNYQDMLDANWKWSDEYFHCKAHCEAAKCGSKIGGFVGWIREVTDYPRNLWRGYSHRDAIDDWEEDKQANQHGRRAGKNGEDCKCACDKYRLQGLPEKY